MWVAKKEVIFVISYREQTSLGLYKMPRNLYKNAATN